MDSMVSKSTIIQAQPKQVWDALTAPDLIRQWLSGEDITVSTDWQAGSPITHQGTFHGAPYHDKGIILQVERDHVLRYSQWSILTEVPDSPEYYTIIEFRLTAQGDSTLLSLTHSNMLTDVQYKHTAFYWNVTLYKIKMLIEQGW